MSGFGKTDEQDIEELKRENTKLLNEIADLCDQRDEDEVENIFLLGLPGAGKSSLINTVIKVVAGKYIPKAKVGSGGSGTKTLILERFQSCGVTERNIVGSQKDTVNTILPKLPNLFDAAGILDNGYTERVEEILELLIGGFIPPNTSIDSLIQLQKKHNVGCLQNTFYTNSKPEWKMTKVVFVHSCRQKVPSDLIRCLDKILRKTDPMTVQPKYRVDVFVVITKCDLVKESDHGDHEYVSMGEFKETEDCLAEQFSIKGALRDNVIHWTSYCDRNIPDSPYIDNVALKFLKRIMMTPGDKNEPATHVITRWKLWKLKPRKILNEKMYEVFFKCVLMIIVAILLYKLLSANSLTGR